MDTTIQNPTPPKKNSNKLLIIGCSCLALLVLCSAVVGGSIYFMRDSDKKDESRDDANRTTPTPTNGDGSANATPTPELLITTISSDRVDRKYTDRKDMSEEDIKKYRLDLLAKADGIALEKVKALRALADFYPDKSPTPTPSSTTEPTVSPTMYTDGATPTPSPTKSSSLTPTPVGPTPVSPKTYGEFLSYITPSDDAVQAVAKNKSKEELYKQSLKWVWVEDLTLHKTNELWMKPADFLKNTPSMSTNPMSNRIVSDCEEHAMTLVSALRASGVKPENVRVAIGKVNFGGNVGGHAWVQYFDERDQKWFELEPSAGDTVDPVTKKYTESEGFPFEYFKTNKYSSVEEYLYFNDKYFMDLTNKKTNAPSNW